MDNNLFSERLKEARLTAKLKQTELAKISGVTAATISAYECADGNKGKNPSLDNALKLAQALNVSLDWLCGTTISNDRVQISDFLRILVKLDNAGYGIALDNVDLYTLPYKEILPKASEIYTLDDYLEMQQICDETEADYSFPNISVTFNHHLITDFLTEWAKLRELHRVRTIDDNLYNLWLNQQYQKIDSTQKANEDFYEFLSSNKEGSDENGND